MWPAIAWAFMVSKTDAVEMTASLCSKIILWTERTNRDLTGTAIDACLSAFRSVCLPVCLSACSLCPGMSVCLQACLPACRPV